VGIERLLVHASQYNELYDVICRRSRELKFGPVLAPRVTGFQSTADCGSMINTDRFRDLERILDDSENDGATIGEGGRRYIHPYFDSGAFFPATVVGNPDPLSEIAQKERRLFVSIRKQFENLTGFFPFYLVFAPVALLQSYETVEEAIELANGTRYGLGASIFGPDQTYCVEVAKTLECGMVSINDFGVFYVRILILPSYACCSYNEVVKVGCIEISYFRSTKVFYSQDLPFGGTKASGYGRFGKYTSLEHRISLMVNCSWARRLEVFDKS
jgi:acyl-CoA reductase-like NAD-dependent aldehyde dehydrogenase